MESGFVQRVAEQALLRGVKNVDVSTSFELDVVFVSEEKIKSINKEYRDKDEVTDVLSFGEYADSPAGTLMKENISIEIFSENAVDSDEPRSSRILSLSGLSADVHTKAGALSKEDAGLPSSSRGAVVVLGQLFLCYDYIKRAAEEDGVSLEREMAYVLSHGVLHLLGYDHTEEMFAIQDTISEQFV